MSMPWDVSSKIWAIAKANKSNSLRGNGASKKSAHTPQSTNNKTSSKNTKPSQQTNGATSSKQPSR